MFNKTHLDENIALTFIKSASVQAYPCGRRRSSIVDADSKVTTKADQYRIPFDPEARLNTEANNRKHSSLNGYTQTYLKDWDETNKLLTLSLAGYLFNIKLTEDYLTTSINGVTVTSATKFGQKVLDCQLNAAQDLVNAAKTDADKVTAEAVYNTISGAEKIYANILIEDVHLFSGADLKYFTGVLRNQLSATDIPETSLDLIYKASANFDEMQNFDNYYFSGLSFSIKPFVALAKPADYKPITRDTVPRTIERTNGADKPVQVEQVLVSLCILEKDGSAWKIHEPARLPFIEHGETVDSIVVGNTLVKDDLTVTNHTKSNTIEVINSTTTANLTVTTEAIIKEETVTTADIETADINTLTGTTATITTVNSDDIQQKVNGTYYNVPVMFIQEQADGHHQLQIHRVNRITKQS